MNRPLSLLRHHVSGSIARGENIAIVEQASPVVNTIKYIAGTNMPGYMPDNIPAEFDTQDEAKRYIIECLEYEEQCVETEDEAEQLSAFAEEVNLQSGEFSAQCLGMVYWVTTE